MKQASAGTKQDSRLHKRIERGDKQDCFFAVHCLHDRKNNTAPPSSSFVHQVLAGKRLFPGIFPKDGTGDCSFEPKSAGHNQ